MRPLYSIALLGLMMVALCHADLGPCFFWSHYALEGSKLSQSTNPLLTLSLSPTGLTISTHTVPGNWPVTNSQYSSSGLYLQASGPNRMSLFGYSTERCLISCEGLHISILTIYYPF